VARPTVAERGPEARSAARRTLLPSLLGYAVVFGLLGIPLLRHAGAAVPRTSDPNDAQLIIWILASVARSLLTAPRVLFEAGINYPAPHQLTGSEHLLSAQLAFAPLWLVMRNPVLATNLTLLISYVLGALAMQRLLLALGCGIAVASLIGLHFTLALSPLNVQALQYPNLYLPLVALCLVRLRAEPDLRWALALAAAFGLGVANSYYMAVMLSLMACGWGMVELLRGGPGRARFLLLAIAAGGVALAIVAVVLTPYLARGANEPPYPVGSVFLLVKLRELLEELWANAWRWREPGVSLHAILVILALVGVVAGGSAARSAAVPGILFHFLGWSLTYGYPHSLAGLIAHSPLRFFRLQRFVVLAAFGTSLLLATGLATVRHWLGRAGELTVLAVACGLFVAPEVVEELRLPIRPLEAYGAHAPVYDAVGKAAQDGGAGPLLELPLGRARQRGVAGGAAQSFEPESMLGSTRHGLPLIAGYTGYQPPHRKLLLQTIALLPAPQPLDELVDMTHLRWILIRPAGDWPSAAARARFLDSLRALPAIGPSTEIGDWTLLRVARRPEHPEWFQAIAAGGVTGRTVLGTPLAPLAAENAVASVVARDAPGTVRGGSLVRLTLEITNRGRTAWPAAIAPARALTLSYHQLGRDPPRPYAVRISARWVAGESGPGETAEESREIRRDVPAGETIVQELVLAAPARPGDYLLEVRVGQLDGAAFDVAGNAPLLLRVRVT